MAFDIYPQPPTAPHHVAANSSSPALIAITQRAGPDNVAEAGTTVTNNPTTMFIRLAMLGPAPPPGNEPTIILKANTGAETEITGGYSPPTAIPDGVNIDAADGIKHPADANNVYLVKVLVYEVGLTWQMRVKNNDAAAHDFTWVVADSLANSRQPWIDAPAATLQFDALTGQSPPPRLTITIPNKGTGPLTITDTVGSNAGDPAFKIAVVPGSIAPNSTGDIKIDFNPPAVIGETSANYDVGSNDSNALTAAGHNKRVPLRGAARQLEIALVVDASGSMGYTPNGPPEVVNADSDARWGKLKIAAKQFLDVLGTLGNGEGQFGISVFPDFTIAGYPGIPAPSPSAGDIFTTQPITAANLSQAKTNLDAPPPAGTPRKAEQDKGATPIGTGIGHTMGAIANSFGYFTGTEPAKSLDLRFMVLMTDGAQNSGPDPSVFFGAGPTSFNAKNIKVIGVAYGNPNSGFQVDPKKVHDIVNDSHGVFEDPNADKTGFDLKKSFRAAITAGLTADPTSDPSGILTPAAPEVRQQVSIIPYDTRAVFVVDWQTFNPQRVTVSLLTPTCELITPASASADPNIVFHSNANYVVYGFNNDYLRNSADPANPRYGIWRLIIRANISEEETEPYAYEVITESRLKLKLATDQGAHFAGDTIKLIANLTLDGKGVPNAKVTASLNAPGTSADNFLAENKITAAEFTRTKERFSAADITALGIKAFALKDKNIFFVDQPFATQIQMKDAGAGQYTAKFVNTAAPGSYQFYVTAIGETEDGVTFRREQRLKVLVTVRPDPAFTLIDTIFRTQVVGGQVVHFADVRVVPRDRFGNVVLVDPEFDSSIALTTTAGEFTGALTWNLDASYSRTLSYPSGVTPSIGLVVDGHTVVTPQPLPALDRLRYVDRVIDFDLGGEATPGANKHRDPKAALGDITKKAPDVFVSLGARGALILAVDGQVMVAKQGDDDITVFVHPDEEPRPYSVDVLPITLPVPILIPGLFKWVSLGTSPGVTQSFSMRRAGVKRAVAIRITDKSGRTRDSHFQPSATPGVSIAGVGVKKTAEFPGGSSSLLEIIKQILELLLREGGDKDTKGKDTNG
jgi:hypothetical protein